MTIDLNNYLFWVVGAIWFTVPILSWAWSLASMYFYRKLTTLMGDATKAFEQIKTLNEQMTNYRLETMEIRNHAEEELNLACTYYAKISEMLAKDKEEK